MAGETSSVLDDKVTVKSTSLVDLMDPKLSNPDFQVPNNTKERIRKKLDDEEIESHEEEVDDATTEPPSSELMVVSASLSMATPPTSTEFQTTTRRSSSKSCLKKLVEQDANETTTTSEMGLAKRVSFHKLEISEYPMEMGDNPSASGVPITIGWKPQEQYTYDVEDYEAMKPTPRSRLEMQIPSSMRYDMLAAQGTTMKQMREAMEANKKIQMRRSKSVNNMKWDKMNYAFEKAQRKIKRVASLGSMPKGSSFSLDIKPSFKSSSSATAADPLDCSRHSQSARLSISSERSDEPVMF